MPSKNKQYNLVQSDDLDTRIPLMPEEAFQHGIPFNCKFIGSMDIPRPTSRVEIVAAMRRVRVEFKSKGVKKKKVTLTVSVDGMKTTLRKKNRKRKKRSNSYVDVDGPNSMVVQSHPIYRIFYVSHDSQDVKIFSYIARETSSNVFHCCVFKAANKNQAMRIVRTVGQAFEVCHKLVGTAGEDDEPEEAQESDTNVSSVVESKPPEIAPPPIDPPPVIPEQQSNVSGSSTSLPDKAGSSSSSTPPILASGLNRINEIEREITPTQKPHKPQNLDLSKRDNDLMNLHTPSSSAVPTPTQTQSFFKDLNTLHSNIPVLSPKVRVEGNKENLAQVHEAQLLKEQLEQQTQNTRAALAQIQLLRDQLAAESAARIEAQARTHQLLIHNKELLDHLQTLVRTIQELESGGGGFKQDRGSNNSIAAATGVTLPQLTPRSKIERWFSFVVPASIEQDTLEDGEYNLDKRNVWLSRRTLTSNRESGFVSETNELEINSKKISRRRKSSGKQALVRRSSSNNRHVHATRLSSTSSWLRRVLRMKRNARGMDYYNAHARSSSTTKNTNNAQSISPTLQRVNSFKSRVSSL